MTTLPASGSALLGVGLVILAVAIGAYLALSPRPVQVPPERRRPRTKQPPSLLTRATGAATRAIDRVLRRRGGPVSAEALERAGVAMRVQDFTLLVIAGALGAAATGLLLGGPALAVVLAVAAPLVAKVYLGRLAARRQQAFADQLDDSLQLMASNLRAGHSLLQALDSVAREAEEPTSVEFARIVNETRVGRPLARALEEVSQRMASEDFDWVTQAIAINREVGGNLAEVLDGVGHTIRERGRLRRQVSALSAEGRLSALILMALPFGITAFLAVANPAYLAAFTESVLGYALIGISLVMLAVGGVWLRKVVSFKF
ncbi:type II secretion system F family protein [Georgenia subflava]|uniref:Type II secretion system protein F n=1 Tax=Georgenia subflava TaxID=1622177 RepID=A0A6N7EG62_9MICO|nr:type II secretion system F family protein [Georgenia subflava]MPV37020.1 type II secretion system protein F [Georgenia subflava]